ncbi:unnamed protein product [Angiostrongylus costaricensis]|uniref:FSA_C domain-containing protein n=1 Tax=Angiostrongylus costaricensis TaxID=334426 RepID=A0A158PMC3_ANGCS|nr:unnamed protein product [Angiostrongylus costaricensis]
MNVSYGHHGDIFGTIKFKLDDGTIDPEKRSFWVLLSSLVLFEAWIIFLTYYFSRITGPIVSFLLNSSCSQMKTTQYELTMLGWYSRTGDLFQDGKYVSQGRIRLCESAADRALLSVEGQAESVRAAFLKHPDYTGKPYKDPPRTMGDGFAILQSALLHFFYRQDILAFTLSFNDFLPEIVSSTYTIHMGSGLALRVRYPVGSAMAPILAALSRGAHTSTYCTPSRHGKHSINVDEWHEIWRTESINAVIKYSYHPTVSKIASDLPSHVLQEFLPKSLDHPKDLSIVGTRGNLLQLTPDKMDVTLEIGGSEVKLTGSLIKCIIGLKDNYFGLYDSMTDVTQPEEPSTVRSVYSRVPPNAPVEAYRCMEVMFDMRVSNIRAHCITYTSFSEEQEFCPVFYTEEIVLQIKKGFKETLIQVGVTPCAAYFSRASAAHNDGYLALSGFQFRGHAMFSPVDCPWDMSVVEYCWLTEILVGEIITLVNFLDTLLLLLIAKDEAKKVPEKFKFCQHGQKNKMCSVGSQPGRPCESEERYDGRNRFRLKYRQMRVSVDGIQLSLADECAAITVIFHVLESNTWIECARTSIVGVSLDIELPLTPDSSRLDTLRLKFLKKHDSETKRLQFLWNPTTVWGCACYGDTAFMTMNDSM